MNYEQGPLSEIERQNAHAIGIAVFRRGNRYRVTPPCIDKFGDIELDSQSGGSFLTPDLGEARAVIRRYLTRAA